ncbi:pentatricopeptide repeat-containing protein At3g12770-like [Zingiber officinale]|uniref:pentatricopeptide repeat-containing protein At3g12770-like n=1 Tax=Zingiber officinale TaxID=94328 RepID=UPI001C4CFBF2|nr:pentatricopeptide repeat-containing protein At3g12770-like [Zingiber officinale]XP_042388736.1 pentatricopeptide repeat-containing protein At3g12770-like [Zingiber officinale]XP_042388737.1 pentatricopeptide repeat-containing protein At3g12770-like [Zingiber officinale]
MVRTLAQLHTDAAFPSSLAPDGAAFLHSVSSLSALKCLHAVLLKQRGLFLHVATKLLALAASLSPSVRYARNLFDAAPRRDSFMWNTLLRAYADLGPCNEVPFLYAQMHAAGLSPDHFTFPFVVRACAVASAFCEGVQAHCDALRHGFASNPFLQTALVTMYAQNGEVSDAELVFREMHFRNIVSWTSMIAGYVQNFVFGEALGVFRRMVASGTPPNEITMVSVLPALRGPESLVSGMAIHGFAIKLGFDSHPSLANALIAMYARCGSTSVARSLFDEMPDRNLVSWNTMIAMYEQSGEGGKAIKLFRAMLTERVPPNGVTLVSLISACAATGALETGRWAHGFARNRGLDADVRVGNALVDMYGRCGSVEEARQVFDSLTPKGVVTWSAMIRSYAAHGRVGDALNLFDEMCEQGLRPNTFTYTSVLAACSHGGLVEEGLRHLDGMRAYGLTPTLEHCTCMVDLLGRAGRLAEAYKFIKGMAVEPDIGVWGALLGACRIHGELEMAEAVTEELSPRLGCRNSTVYVLMANMYAEAGRWEEAERVRERMREMELRKDPGQSFVNTDKSSSSIQRSSSMQQVFGL